MAKKRISPLLTEDGEPKEPEQFYAKVRVSSPTEVWEEHTCQSFTELYFILHLIANNLVNLALQDSERLEE